MTIPHSTIHKHKLKLAHPTITMATTDKYDRQLRLWGASGQRALGNTLVVLVGTSACGTETLKNLVREL